MHRVQTEMNRTAFMAENRTRNSMKIRPLSPIRQYVNERFSVIKYVSQTERHTERGTIIFGYSTHQVWFK